MAKVYNSRSLIDPNMYSVMNQQIQNRVANQLNRDKMLGESVRHMLTGIGETTDDYIGRYQREKELQNAEANKDSLPYIEDPIYRAAREEYIRTGSSQPISSYMLQKEAAKARALEAKKATSSQQWHNSLEEGAARDKFNTLTEQALDAQKAGNLVRANNLANQANRLRDTWSVRGVDIGDDVQSILEAAAQEEADRLAKKEAEDLEKQAVETDAKTLELANKAKEQYSFNTRMNVENNVLPNAKNIGDKTNYKKMVKQLYDNGKLTEDDTKLLLNKIDFIETIGEKTKKSVEGTIASKEGEKTGKKIDEKTEKKKLADAGRKAIQEGKEPTRKQKKAIDEGY